MVKKRATKRAPRFVANQFGGAWYNDLWNGVKKVGGFIKDNKLVSKGLNAAGLGKYGKIASQIGLGRKRRAAPRAGPKASGSSVIRFR